MNGINRDNPLYMMIKLKSVDTSIDVGEALMVYELSNQV